MRAAVDINSDMGEGFGPWTFDDDVDAQMMPLVSSINVAGGFHGGDPSTIDRTAALAKEYGVGVGAHPGFRDLVGFGRRHIEASADELVCDVLYQLGAVRALIGQHGLNLQHLKLHGALYMHAARDEEFATALVEALDVADSELPVLAMAGSVLDRVARRHGHPVVCEFYGDRHYGDDGQIVFTRDVGSLEPDAVAAKVVQACREGTVETVTGSTVPIEFDSICLHSDTRGASRLVAATRAALEDAGIAVRSFA
ncbi:5-oxoprolinase subunit PxpA [Streptomyces sp. NPDC052042]|uniref:5-oxoprolinase subunit PxpA n=1 Tax=Streptomyces sp. NPDC052042 TaxID=3365683 RepID=UPI0037D62A66